MTSRPGYAALIVGAALVGVVVLMALVREARTGSDAPWPVPADPGELASYPPLAGLPATGSVTLSGAGDIAVCGSENDEATAGLLDDLPGLIFTTGDNAYDDGTPSEFEECFGTSWGRHRDRILPALGNHDVETERAGGYFGYFGGRAGDPRAGWYAVTLGSWRVLVLNSHCELIGGCGPESAQGRWLARELETNATACTVALWHHPLFSTGDHGPTEAARPLWEILHPAGVDLVINGHDHSYERFAPLDAAGNPDPEGIRQIVVGTGGAHLRGFPYEDPNSEARDHSTHGVLRLDLHDGSYDWRFIPVETGALSDSGSGTCH